MSGRARIMFCWPQDRYDALGHVIEWGEDNTDAPCHVVVVLPDCLGEALAGGFMLTPLDKYVHRHHRTFDLEVPYPELSEAAITYLRHFRYGYLSCVYGLLRDKFHVRLPWVPTAQEDCSQAGTEFISFQGRRLFGLDNPAGITPYDLLNKFLSVGATEVDF